jgi:hypothetical protein
LELLNLLDFLIVLLLGTQPASQAEAKNTKTSGPRESCSVILIFIRAFHFLPVSGAVPIETNSHLISP